MEKKQEDFVPSLPRRAKTFDPVQRVLTGLNSGKADPDLPQDGPLKPPAPLDPKELWLRLVFAVLVVSTLPVIIIFLLKALREPVDLAMCQYRFGPDGDGSFQGNPDIYGLGIRLGIYLQWIASILANTFVRTQGRHMATGYVAFQIALLIAMLLLVFLFQCTFTIEIVLLLYLLFGGMFVCIDQQLPEEWELYKSRGFDVASIAVIFVSLIYSGCFWIALGQGSIRSLIETPGGTSIFFFARVTGTAYHNVAFVQGAFSLWLLYVVILLPLYADRIKIKSKFGIAFAISVLPLIPVFLFFKALRVVYNVARSWLLRFVKGLYKKFGSVEHTTRRESKLARIWAAIIPKEEDWDEDHYLIAACDTACGIWMGLAVELTLKWNKVTGVYSIDSTGQLIPLVLGILACISLVWKFWGVFQSRYWPNENLPITFRTNTAFQSADGRWRVDSGTTSAKHD